MKFSTRKMEYNHLESVVNIHINSFENFFLTKLGKRFLKFYYSKVLDYPVSVALVAEDKEGKILGFISGFKNPNKFYKHLKTPLAIFLWNLVIPFITNFWLIAKFIENNKRIRKIDSSVNSFNNIELSSIASLEKGKGIGSKLIKDFIVKSKSLNSREIRLTTDYENNDKTINFYKKNGFFELELIQRNKRKLIVFKREY